MSIQNEQTILTLNTDPSMRSQQPSTRNEGVSNNQKDLLTAEKNIMKLSSLVDTSLASQNNVKGNSNEIVRSKSMENISQENSISITSSRRSKVKRRTSWTEGIVKWVQWDAFDNRGKHLVHFSMDKTSPYINNPCDAAISSILLDYDKKAERNILALNIVCSTDYELFLQDWERRNNMKKKELNFNIGSAGRRKQSQLPQYMDEYIDIYNKQDRVGIYTPSQRAAKIAKFRRKRGIAMGDKDKSEMPHLKKYKKMYMKNMNVEMNYHNDRTNTINYNRVDNRIQHTLVGTKPYGFNPHGIPMHKVNPPIYTQPSGRNTYQKPPPPFYPTSAPTVSTVLPSNKRIHGSSLPLNPPFPPTQNFLSKPYTPYVNKNIPYSKPVRQPPISVNKPNINTQIPQMNSTPGTSLSSTTHPPAPHGPQKFLPYQNTQRQLGTANIPHANKVHLNNSSGFQSKGSNLRVNSPIPTNPLTKNSSQQLSQNLIHPLTTSSNSMTPSTIYKKNTNGLNKSVPLPPSSLKKTPSSSHNATNKLELLSDATLTYLKSNSTPKKIEPIKQTTILSYKVPVSTSSSTRPTNPNIFPKSKPIFSSTNTAAQPKYFQHRSAPQSSLMPLKNPKISSAPSKTFIPPNSISLGPLKSAPVSLLKSETLQSVPASQSSTGYLGGQILNSNHNTFPPKPSPAHSSSVSSPFPLQQKPFIHQKTTDVPPLIHPMTTIPVSKTPQKIIQIAEPLNNLARGHQISKLNTIDAHKKNKPTLSMNPSLISIPPTLQDLPKQPQISAPKPTVNPLPPLSSTLVFHPNAAPGVSSKNSINQLSSNDIQSKRLVDHRIIQKQTDPKLADKGKIFVNNIFAAAKPSLSSNDMTEKSSPLIRNETPREVIFDSLKKPPTVGHSPITAKATQTSILSNKSKNQLQPVIAFSKTSEVAIHKSNNGHTDKSLMTTNGGFLSNNITAMGNAREIANRKGSIPQFLPTSTPIIVSTSEQTKEPIFTGNLNGKISPGGNNIETKMSLNPTAADEISLKENGNSMCNRTNSASHNMKMAPMNYTSAPIVQSSLSQPTSKEHNNSTLNGKFQPAKETGKNL